MNQSSCAFLIGFAISLHVLHVSRCATIGYIGERTEKEINDFISKARKDTNSTSPLHVLYPEAKKSTGVTFASVCKAYSTGIVTFINDFSDDVYRARLQSLSVRTQVPLIYTGALRGNQPAYTIGLHPGPYYEGKISKELVLHFGWMTFLLLYETDEDLISIQYLLTVTAEPHRPKIRLKRLPTTRSKLVVFLKSVRNELKARSIVVHASLEMSRRIYETFINVLKMNGSEYSYIFTHSDLLSIIKDDKFSDVQSNLSFLVPQKDYTFSLNKALHEDALSLVLRAVNLTTDIKAEHIACDSTDYWPQGEHFFKRLTQISFAGASRRVQLDKEGKRRNVRISVYQSSNDQFKKIAQWTDSKKLQLIPSPKPYYSENDTELANKTLRVIVLLEEPFVMYKPQLHLYEGNDRYEGFCIELLEEIAKALKFKYVIKEVKDDSYGSKDAYGKWNGIIGELQRWEADLAMSALTVSHNRFEAVDFTVPFMHLGISILFKRSSDDELHLFTFLRPLSLGVWLFLIASYFLVSMMMWLLARFSPYEWYNPNPRSMRTDSAKNQFNVINSFWFSVGSLMQQGSDVSPRAPSTRIVAVAWWLFTLVLISSYTAQLAAFLTVARMSTSIANAEDLSRQARVKYGILASGSTMDFFKESQIPSYQRIWSFISSANPSVFVNSTKEGIARVKAGDYAYFMESSMLEYYAERDCELMQIGGLLDSKGYAVALPKGSPYRAAISQAILLLQDTTAMESLKDRWWRAKRGKGKCGGKSEKSRSAKMEAAMKDIGGIFLVLIGGSLGAFAVAVLEFIHRIRRKDAQTAQLTWIYHVWKTVARSSSQKHRIVENTPTINHDVRHRKPVKQRNNGESIRSKSSSQDEDRVPLAFDAY